MTTTAAPDPAPTPPASAGPAPAPRGLTAVPVPAPPAQAPALPGQRGYAVSIGPGAAVAAAARLPELLASPPSRAFIVRDAGVPDPFADAVVHALEAAGYAVRVETLVPSERIKTIATWQALLARLAETRHERLDPVVALGGGIVGDLAGYVAAAYRRGCPVLQIPTTLLAAVDASVGGKTGLNLDPTPTPTPTPFHPSPSSPHPLKTQDSKPRASTPLLKNFLGAFHFPLHVAADTDALRSLPPRILSCGLAECIKHALIADTPFLADARDPALLDWTEHNAPRVRAGDPHATAEIIERSVRIKAAVVSTDPYELAPSAAGGRALLNLGHTFAHAIETLPVRRVPPLAHQPPLAVDGRSGGVTVDGDASPDDTDQLHHPHLLHGEAVALGLIAAATTAARLGLCDADLPARVERLAAAAGLPTRAADLPPSTDLLAAMGHDKKVRAGRIRLVLPDAPGRCRVVENPDPAAVAAGWDALRA